MPVLIFANVRNDVKIGGSPILMICCKRINRPFKNIAHLAIFQAGIEPLRLRL